MAATERVQRAKWMVFSKRNDTKLHEKKLAYLPAFDGLVAANGRLYMATQCGSLVCYEGK